MVAQELQAGTSRDRVSSCDGRFTLVMQTDGNLVLYWNGVGALWATNTVGSGAVTAVIQSDGNFVVYTAGGTPVWNSGTFNNGYYWNHLAIQNDGNLVVYNYNGGGAVWNSGTCCH